MEVIPISRTEIEGAHLNNTKRKCAACMCVTGMYSW